MSGRVFFLVGDFFINIAVGAAAALAVTWLIPSSWNAPAAMPLGMLLGMLVAGTLGTAAMPVLGAFEVMLPTMVSGMAAGMLASMYRDSSASAALTGAVIGLVTISGTYLLTLWSQRG